MSTTPNHQHAIAWLESTSRWFRARAELVNGNARDLAQVMKTMVFVSPVGDRVRRSIQLTNKNLGSLERELEWMAAVTAREVTRLRSLDQRVAELMKGAALDMIPEPTLAAELAEYRANQAAWEARCFPPEPVPEDPDADVGTDTAIDDGSPVLEPMPEFGTGDPITLPTGPATKDRRVMEIATIRLAADHIAAVSRAMQDHQTAILRALSDIPTDLSQRLHRRLTRSRQACAGGFERQAPRLLRQSTLLQNRVRTPGLDDGLFTSSLEPIPGVPREWLVQTRDLKLYDTPLIPLSEQVVAQAQELRITMEVLFRTVKAIFGTDVVIPLPPVTGAPAGPGTDPGTGRPIDPIGNGTTTPGEHDGSGTQPPGGGGPTDPTATDPTINPGTTDPTTTGSTGDGQVTSPDGTAVPDATTVLPPQTGSGIAADTGSAATDFVRGTGATVVTGAGAYVVAGGAAGRSSRSGGGGGGGGGGYDAQAEADAAAAAAAAAAGADPPADGTTDVNAPAAEATATSRVHRHHDFSVRQGRHHHEQVMRHQEPMVEATVANEASAHRTGGAPVAASAAGAVVAGTAGGVVMSNKKSRRKISDWKSYVADRASRGADEEGST